jgi:CheY-like chemotaxis protein
MAIPNRIATRLIGVWLILAVVQGVCAQEPAAPVPAPMAPGVAAIMATKPATPAEKVRAAKILAGLDRPDLAKQMLAEVLAANLDQQQLFELDQQFGAPLFVRFSALPQLAPEGKQLADAVLQAARAVLEDSARLDDLVRQLPSADMGTRTAAFQGLMQGGRVSIGVLIGALADPARDGEHEMARSALGQFGQAAVGPLLAAMHGGDANLKIQAIRTLAGIGAREAVPFFLAPAVAPGTDEQLQTIAQRGLVTFGRPVPDISVASAMLVQEAEDYLNGRKRFREDLDGNVTVWTWDTATGRPASTLRPARDASMVYAAWLAEDAHLLTPNDRRVRVLYLACLLEQAAQAAGLENRLPIAADSPAGIAAAAGLEIVEEVLQYAMDKNYIEAAIAAVRILGERGSVLGQLSADRSASPLTGAVKHNDPRLRFAALEAIIGLDPTTPFAGSNAVVEAVCHFATSQGERRVLVAGPSTSESQRIAGHLFALGYVCDTARSGRELMALALRSADYEFVLADEGLQQPTVEFLLQQLRHDNRTAHLPVGIWARDGRLPRAEHAARRDPLVTAFPRPHSQETVESQVDQVLALAGRQRLNSDQRLQQAGQAMQWLADWSAGHQVFRLPKRIDAVYEALFIPELAPQATTILANTGTPEAQKALIELASRWTQPLPRRKAAVEALWNNAEGYGILLTSAEILRQYDRYNESETLDPPSQQVLSAILNCLEAPAKVMQEAKKLSKDPKDSEKP